MNSIRVVLVVGFLIPALPVHARMELALIPKVGYVAPTDKSQRVSGAEHRFEPGLGYGAALEFRKVFGRGEMPCGFAIGPEYLRYAYRATRNAGAVQQTSRASTIAPFIASKFLCATGNARYSIGTGVGVAENNTGASPNWLGIGEFYQFGAAAEFGGKRLRAYTEFRYLKNTDDPEYDGSGYGIFLGVSFILRELPPLKRR